MNVKRSMAAQKGRDMGARIGEALYVTCDIAACESRAHAEIDDAPSSEEQARTYLGFQGWRQTEGQWFCPRCSRGERRKDAGNLSIGMLLEAITSIAARVRESSLRIDEEHYDWARGLLKEAEQHCMMLKHTVAYHRENYGPIVERGGAPGST